MVIRFSYLGDSSDKFFMIIKGKVSVIVPKEETVELSEEEYLVYLSNLRKFGEIELLNQALIRKGFKIKDPDFESWLKTVNKQKTFSSKSNNFMYKSFNVEIV